MKKLKSAITIILAAVLMLMLLAGCAAKKPEEPAAPVEPTEPSEPEQTAERSYPYTFTDLAGKDVTIDKAVETVYIVGSLQPLTSIYRYYRGNSDGLLQCPEAAQKIISSTLLAEIWPDIPALTAHGDDTNVEEVLALNPDVVLMTGSATGEAYEALAAAGLTIVNFPTASSGYDTDPFATISAWLGQMGELFGDSTAADKLIDYNNNTLLDVAASLENVNEADKPRALIIMQIADNTLRAAGTGHYSEFWLEKTGAFNAAAEIDKLQQVNIEQIMAWDPDIIYLTTFNTAMPDDLYNNTIDGLDFSQIRAVQNKQVYKVPLGSYRWYAPSCECALMLRWMAQTNHPELFADTDMEKVTSDFYKEFYGYELSTEQAHALLNPAEK